MITNEIFYYDLRNRSGLAHTVTAQVVREIGRRIVCGLHQTGGLLEDEYALAQNYRVSRSVIRDAIKILVGKGLLEVRRGIGTRVCERAHWNILDDDVLAWHQSAPADSEFLANLIDFRFLIEPKAANYAAMRGNAEAHNNIVNAVERMEREKGSIQDFIIADASFHRSVLRATNNELFYTLEGVIFSTLLISIRITNTDPRENKASIPSHRAVADAIVARDGALAETRMEKLLTDAKKKLGGANE